MPMKNDSPNSSSGTRLKGQLVVNGNTYPALSSVIRRGEVNGFAIEGSKFPRIEDCVHFHYETIDYDELQISLADSSTSSSINNSGETQLNIPNKNDEKPAFCVKITCKNLSWAIRRSLEHFEILDSWLHECIFERSFSCLPELKAKELHSKSVNQIYDDLRLYLAALSHLARGNQISCAPILHWFECDNHGRNLRVPHALGDVADINIPAIAAASVVRRYTAQDDDELDLEVGDMVSIIEMGESGWWRGKKKWRVGSFPSLCVRRISSSSDFDACSKSPPSASNNSTPNTRPSKILLRRKGILRERVFGSDLCELLHRTGEQIPAVVTDCTKFVEKHGIVDGIYRISGVSSQIRLLRYEFDTENRVDLESEVAVKKGNGISGISSEGNIICDPHSVAGLCKRYFRDLPNPLITYQLYTKFAVAVTEYEDEKRLLKVHDVIQQLPPPHYRTLKHVIMHLRFMASHSDCTSMHSRNLAIVWAPNLLRSKEIEAGKLGPSAFDAARIQSVITEFLILNCDLLFSETLETLQFDSEHKPPRPRSLMIVPTPKLISLEEAQELSKSGKLSAATADSGCSSSTALATTTGGGAGDAATAAVKYRDHDKTKSAHERRKRGPKQKTFSLLHDSSSTSPTVGNTSILQAAGSSTQTLSTTGCKTENRIRSQTDAAQLQQMIDHNAEVDAKHEGGTSSRWRAKFGRFWKKSNGMHDPSVCRRASLRRSMSDDSLVSSRNSSTQGLAAHQQQSNTAAAAADHSYLSLERTTKTNIDNTTTTPHEHHRLNSEPVPSSALRHFSSKSADHTIRDHHHHHDVGDKTCYSDHHHEFLHPAAGSRSYPHHHRSKVPRPQATFFSEYLMPAPRHHRKELSPPYSTTEEKSDDHSSDFDVDFPAVMENGLDFDPLSYCSSTADIISVCEENAEDPISFPSFTVKRVSSVLSINNEPVFAAVTNNTPSTSRKRKEREKSSKLVKKKENNSESAADDACFVEKQKTNEPTAEKDSEGANIPTQVNNPPPPQVHKYKTWTVPRTYDKNKHKQQDSVQATKDNVSTTRMKSQEIVISNDDDHVITDESNKDVKQKAGGGLVMNGYFTVPLSPAKSLQQISNPMSPPMKESKFRRPKSYHRCLDSLDEGIDVQDCKITTATATDNSSNKYLRNSCHNLLSAYVLSDDDVESDEEVMSAADDHKLSSADDIHDVDHRTSCEPHKTTEINCDDDGDVGKAEEVASFHLWNESEDDDDDAFHPDDDDVDSVVVKMQQQEEENEDSRPKSEQSSTSEPNERESSNQVTTPPVSAIDSLTAENCLLSTAAPKLSYLQERIGKASIAMEKLGLTSTLQPATESNRERTTTGSGEGLKWIKSSTGRKSESYDKNIRALNNLNYTISVRRRDSSAKLFENSFKSKSNQMSGLNHCYATPAPTLPSRRSSYCRARNINYHVENGAYTRLLGSSKLTHSRRSDFGGHFRSNSVDASAYISDTTTTSSTHHDNFTASLKRLGHQKKQTRTRSTGCELDEEFTSSRPPAPPSRPASHHHPTVVTQQPPASYHHHPSRNSMFDSIVPLSIEEKSSLHSSRSYDALMPLGEQQVTESYDSGTQPFTPSSPDHRTTGGRRLSSISDDASSGGGKSYHHRVYSTKASYV